MTDAEISRLCAEKMKWKRTSAGQDIWHNPIKDTFIKWHPPTSIKQAMILVDWMVERGWRSTIQSSKGEKCHASFTDGKAYYFEGNDMVRERAICIAFLRANNVEVGDE